jgi:hypothetical protein
MARARQPIVIGRNHAIWRTVYAGGVRRVAQIVSPCGDDAHAARHRHDDPEFLRDQVVREAARVLDDAHAVALDRVEQCRKAGARLDRIGAGHCGVAEWCRFPALFCATMWIWIGGSFMLKSIISLPKSFLSAVALKRKSDRPSSTAEKRIVFAVQHRNREFRQTIVRRCGGSSMRRLLSDSKKMKISVAIISLTLLATPAIADPQAEISAYRKSYGLSAVTADPKLTELARQQANAMAERGSMDHNVYAPFRSRMASYSSPSAAENLAMGTKTFGETLALWKSSFGHNANLLKRNTTRIGLASASRHGTTYWALILAAPPEPKQSSVRVLSIFPPIILMTVGAP